jgi:signal transduction histidine kinase
VTVAAGPGDAVEFTIADTGVGIAAEQQTAVFEPFVQAHRDDAGEGVGLGLAITRELVALLGGTIDLRSELGVGTEVTVTLRAAADLGPASDRLRAIDPMLDAGLIALLPPTRARCGS